MKKINVVCIGGGTGLPNLISGLKLNPWLSINAVVTMFDTGGSSGELRDKFGVLPPGDILKCILALSSEDEMTIRNMLLKRISSLEAPGHTGGNILLLGLEKVFGNFINAVDALGQIMSIRGKVHPVTLEQSTLCARFDDGAVLRGETNIDLGIYEGKKVEELFLEPKVECNPEIIPIISGADIICIGPGSFNTSVLPNFLPCGMKETIAGARAKIIFICNLLTEGYGMRNCLAGVFVKTLEEYIGREADRVIVNNAVLAECLDAYSRERKYPILIAPDCVASPKYVVADLWTDPRLARHNQERLSYLVSGVICQLLAQTR